MQDDHAARAAHDLTADEEESHGDTWGTILAEDGPAPDIDRVAQAAIKAVERTLGPPETCKQPASAPDASGGFTSGPYPVKLIGCPAASTLCK